jgi:hypothetical protein
LGCAESCAGAGLGGRHARGGVPVVDRGPFGVPRRLPAQRVDIDGGVVGVLDRDPITGPLGVLLCGGGGAEVVGFDALVGCGWLGVGFDDEGDEDGLAPCASLMAPSLGRSVREVPPWIAAPLGRSVLPRLALVEAAAALFVSGRGGWPAVLLQAAQTRAAATAVAAALAGATVPRIGMDATVAKRTPVREDSFLRARGVRRDPFTVSGRGGFSLDNR